MHSVVETKKAFAVFEERKTVVQRFVYISLAYYRIFQRLEMNPCRDVEYYM